METRYSKSTEFSFLPPDVTSLAPLERKRALPGKSVFNLVIPAHEGRKLHPPPHPPWDSGLNGALCLTIDLSASRATSLSFNLFDKMFIIRVKRCHSKSRAQPKVALTQRLCPPRGHWPGDPASRRSVRLPPHHVSLAACSTLPWGSAPPALGCPGNTLPAYPSAQPERKTGR